MLLSVPLLLRLHWTIWPSWSTECWEIIVLWCQEWKVSKKYQNVGKSCNTTPEQPQSFFISLPPRTQVTRIILKHQEIHLSSISELSGQIGAHWMASVREFWPLVKKLADLRRNGSQTVKSFAGKDSPALGWIQEVWANSQSYLFFCL